MTEKCFTKLYGKKNSAQDCAYKHLTRGTCDIKHIKVSQDMVSTLNSDWKLVVIHFLLTASQKLGKQQKPYAICICIRIKEGLPPQYL